MQHYFIETKHNAEDYFEFTATVLDQNLTIRYCDNIFSKDELDGGTQILLETILKHTLQTKVLDMGCGYGPVGVLLKTFHLVQNLLKNLDHIVRLCLMRT